MFIDRINALCDKLCVPHFSIKDLQLKSVLDADNHSFYQSTTPVHDCLDMLDKHAGIITNWRLGGELAQVGERLRRLERHLEERDTRPFFWLGADAEESMALSG